MVFNLGVLLTIHGPNIGLGYAGRNYYDKQELSGLAG
jgi:hypothetical protein